MADLTTTDGFQYTFKPEAVLTVVDHDGNSGEAVTCVCGVTPGILKIVEPVATFLDRIGMSAKFARLTRGNGAPIWINAPAVGAIRAPLQNEYVATVRSVIAVGNLTTGVSEDPAGAKGQINAHGGKM